MKPVALPRRVDHTTTLRRLRLGDAPAIFAAVDSNRRYLARWLPWVDSTLSVADTRAFLRIASQRMRAARAIHFGIWRRHRLIGVISLDDIDRKRGRAFIGYWLDEGLQGQGIMTRAARALTAYGFALGLTRIEICCDPRNQRSRRIPERLGYQRELGPRTGEHAHHLLYVAAPTLRARTTKMLPGRGGRSAKRATSHASRNKRSPSDRTAG
jgi:ribosomal-protein-serine acetyltransferase